ncbi:hypothetical protein ACS46_00250, partial [Bacillus cereus]
LSVFTASLFVGCSDDPQATNEEEVITTFLVTLTPAVNPTPEVGDTIKLSWDDANLDAIVDASEVITSGSLQLNESYKASIQILNKSVDPEIDISDEVREEDEEHILCFTVTNVSIAITNLDEDKNGLPVGLESTWTTTTASTGTVTITLRHQPGVKTGDCPGAGDT